MLDTEAVKRAHLKIPLTEGEERSLSQIQFDLPEAPPEEQERSLAAACSLAQSLVARGGVPKIRWLYFTDPSLNMGETKSRKQVFEETMDGRSSVLLDPRFLPVLHYWLFGPQIPPDVINWFLVAVAQHTDLRVLRRSVRQHVRDHGLQPGEICEEFFKLGLEAGLHVEAAWSLRNSVCSMRIYDRPSQR